ncbi:MAG: hypothetical protein V3W44_09855 [Dehalococcoidales bacterium]
MRECNYCTLTRIKKRSKAKGLTVTIQPGTLSTDGIYVHVHKSTEEPNESNRVAWLMEASEECDC